MSKRDHRLYVDDILESVRAVESYVEGIDFDTFINDRKTYSATLREYIVIGEAISAIIDLLEERFPDYEWRMVKDFRNFIVHEYFGVDPRIVWDLTIQELPILKEKLLLLN
ncbi:DUF86 domain-containing protein [Sulfuricurvum sp. RIFCSPLOWO2_12_FULL_43_24]|uniref:HepT-like ribonuclease domain-containing protein n=1 Tax=Sulfuricurvum sp. RIFCSPLOWO2_12_FULL_43_24 TaxID=1802247 RepID=UPI0008C412EC|nr:DUF86 domain-containing protein [Sulfuricurvum sp. RIFCSPLOWO2_12_FULL_43_24]OHD85132.1 MAG: hypothetical protein A3I60_05095 [Sulfuricurvum sp. RIFCSPLOWO2_02_FULL_43_45]OHD87856.1 MAG: hypothetical protein A2Y52_06730 [Sulfuricurvum sp. RIFCSPLOWO2_02_43_6]OHD90204.1 MAG: hypothetical protein A3G19_09830 [Sulfuricurvum sp. RIFCSPLOWO2_12_FULL_43_24]